MQKSILITGASTGIGFACAKAVPLGGIKFMLALERKKMQINLKL